MKFLVSIERDEDGAWVVECPAIPGCVSQGESKDVLSAADYTNYRNVRAVSVLFVLFGSVLVLGGIGLALGKNPNPQEQIHPAVAVGIAVAGLAGAAYFCR